MSSNVRIAETIFNLRKIGLSSSNTDGAMILENEESGPSSDIVSQKKKCPFRESVKILLVVLVLIYFVFSIVFIALVEHPTLAIDSERIKKLENIILNGTRSNHQDSMELSNIRRDIHFLEHGLNSVRDNQTRFSGNVTLMIRR